MSTINLNIKNEHLFRYLDVLFKKQDGKFIVSQNSDFGRLLCAHFKTSETPVPFDPGEFCACFILPKTNHIEDRAARFFIYYDKFDIERLNSALSAEFNIHFKQYYLRGRELGFKQKDIIDSFILRNILLSECSSYQVLHNR
jgi:hypothetical protein